MAAAPPPPSDYTAVFHSHYDQIRQLQRELHSALSAHAKGRRRHADAEPDAADPLGAVQLSRRELEVYNRLLNDEVLLLRFLKKHKFQLPAARAAFLAHVRFRLQTQLDTQSLSTFLASSKCPESLFRFLPQTDSQGRPVGLLSLKDAAGLSQDELLRFFTVMLEVARRWLKDINESRWIAEVDGLIEEEEAEAGAGGDASVLSGAGPAEPVMPAADGADATDDGDWRVLAGSKPPLPRVVEPQDSAATVVVDAVDADFLVAADRRPRSVSGSSFSPAFGPSVAVARRVLSDEDVLRRTVVAQISLVVDLDGVGVSNVNAGLPQPLMHLMSAHFPSMLAHCYVLNFRWVHQGLWTVVKNVLPSGATSRITFAGSVDELASSLGIPKEAIVDAPVPSRCRVFRRLMRPAIQLPRSTWENYVGDLSGSMDEGYHERSASDTDTASHGEVEEEEDDMFFDARSEVSEASTHSRLTSSRASLSRSVSTLSASAAYAAAAHAALPSHLANSRVVQIIRQILSLPLRAFDSALVALARQTFTSIARRAAAALVCFVAVLLVGTGRSEWLQRFFLSSFVGPVLGLSPSSVSGPRRFLPWDDSWASTLMPASI
ncbi:hypothetical protein DFJ74DRAFT_712418 [Hyaloraphidium curvatum]|nr:hypothetical protein DFJ74DRAFT_712418 [Hyaloraphidium curvatum]